LIIGEMQRKLARWSTEDKGRKFDRLLRLIADRTWLAEAARITLSSGGARTPGIDGIDKHAMERNLGHVLPALRAELLAGTYQPLPVRRVYIPKANGKQRPLGIPSLRDRIVQRAMLMAMEPIWESDFHRASYGFRPARSVHHAIRTVKLQLQDGDAQSTAGRWIIEGDLASYFDSVHHRLLLRAVRKRIADQRFLALLWKIIKAGCIDQGLFRASSEGVPQGGVISPLLSNIMLHEFDQWMEANYLNSKVRKDRWAWNFGILKQRPIAAREGRQWKPAVSYCRYADDCAPRRRGGEFYVLALNALKQPCCTRDEGGPLEPGLQDLGSNHRMLLRSNGRGGERDGKGRARPCQVSVEKTSESKPPMNCRKRRNDVKTRGQSLFWDQLGRNLFTAQATSGGRGGVSSMQALVWNVGTCASMRRKQLKRTTRESLSTDAGHRGGVARSSEEGSVMGLERRGDTVQPDRKINRQREESFG